MAEALEPNLRAFAENHLEPILQDLLLPDVKLSALTAEPESDHDQDLHAELHDRSYNLTLGPDLLPALVEYESKGGLGSGRKISFGDYSSVTGVEKANNGGTFRYPKRTMVRIPDADQHGLEVKLDKVERWLTFRAADFGK